MQVYVLFLTSQLALCTRGSNSKNVNFSAILRDVSHRILLPLLRFGGE
jgi:hypothetical protein